MLATRNRTIIDDCFLLSFAGVYSDKRDQVAQIRFIMEFDTDGDSWVCKASVEGMPEPKVYTYKFGEPYSSTDLMGKNFTV